MPNPRSKQLTPFRRPRYVVCIKFRPDRPSPAGIDSYEWFERSHDPKELAIDFMKNYDFAALVESISVSLARRPSASLYTSLGERFLPRLS